MKKTKLNIWRRFCLNWKFEYRFLHKDFYYGIKNLIRWFKIIWKDRDYDHRYIFDILKIKLKHQAYYIGEKNRHVSAKRDAQLMMTCVRLIDKIQSEFYAHEYMNYHHCEYLWIPLEDNKDYSTLKINEIWEKFDDYFKKYKHAYKEVTKHEKFILENNSKINIAINIGHYMENKANRILFDILENHIHNWWD